MVDQAPAQNGTATTATVNTTIDGQDMTCIPTKAAAAAPAESAAPVVSAAGSEESAPVNLNNIAPAAGPAEQPKEEPKQVCEIPGKQAASAEQLANAVTVTKPDAGQTKTYPALADGQTYNMAMDYKDALVETEGKNIVIRFADGATVVLEDFAGKASHTKLIADNCETAPMQFASLNNIAPAAGGNAPAAAAPAAGRNVGNTGAGFSEYDGGNLPNINGPLGPLGATALNYKTIGGLQPEFGTQTPDGKPNGLVGISTPLNVVDETGGGGTDGDFSTPRTTSGNVTIDYGPDGAGSVRILSGPSGLTHHGDLVTVSVSDDGLTATGKLADGTVVFTYSIDSTNSTYTFTQYTSLDHPIPGNPNEALDLPFVVRVTDSDGDYADSTATMRVLDDAPSATVTEGSSAVVDESNGSSLSATGTVTYSFGGDGAGSIKLVDGPSGLTSHGVPVTVAVTDTQITGTAGGVTVFTLTLNTSTGAWEYHQTGALDHPDATNPNDTLDLSFTVRITDYDGDPVDTPITVKVADDGPQLDGESMSASTDETGGVGHALTGHLPVSYGQDGAGDLRLTTTPSGLTSHGQAVTVAVSDDGHTATGKLADGTVVFTLVVDPVSGDYSFTLAAPLDHPDATDPNDILGLGFGYTVTDFDGDSTNGQLTINVHDDAPTAGSASFDAGDLGVAVTGTLPHTFGEDGAGSLKLSGSLTGLTSNGQPVIVTVGEHDVVGKLADGTVVFTLTASETGYSFTQQLDLDGNPTLNVGYTVTDFDGDTASGTISIHTRVDTLPTAGCTENTVDETGGFDTVHGTLPVNYQTDGASATAPITITTTPTGLASHGVPVVVTVSADGLTATGTAHGVTVFTLTITNTATGAYTFTQSAALDHPVTTNPDDVLNLGFGYTVKDSDGDSDNGKLTIHVRDDGPAICEVTTAKVDETNAHDTVGSSTDGIWATATSGTPISATGTVSFSYGSDGAGSLCLTGGPSGLTHHGQAVTVSISGNQAVGTLADGTLVFTLSLNASNGGYTYKQFASLDHANASNPDDVLSMGFKVTVTDADGDSTQANLTVKVNDDGPCAGSDNFCIDQSKLTDDCNPNTPLVTTNGKVNFSYGDDGKGSIQLTSTPGGLYSNGQAVLVCMSGSVITGKLASGQTVFTLAVNADGSYTYKQFAEIDAGKCTSTELKFGYQVTDADGDKACGNLTICVKGDLHQPQPPHISVSVENEVSTSTHTVTLEHNFGETRTWIGMQPESVPVNPALKGIANSELVIGGNYTLPAGVVDTPMHHVSVTYTGEGAGYNNSLGWCVIAADGTISDVKLAIANIDKTPVGSTVDLGNIPAGTMIDFFVIPNGAFMNAGYANLPAGGHFEFWVNGAPGTAGAHLLNANEDPSNIHLFYVAPGSTTEIKFSEDGVFFAAHENLNTDNYDHIIAGIDSSNPDALQLGFEDLKCGGDLDHNDLLFSVNVCPAEAVVTTKTFCSDLSALVTDPDSSKLSHATVTLNGVTGDTLDLGDGYTVVSGNVLHNGVDTGIDFARTTDGGFTLAGSASLNTYQDVLDSVQLHTSSTTEGLRTASFQVTDETGLNSNVDTVSLYPSTGSCGCGGEDDDVLSHPVQDPVGGCGQTYVYTGHESSSCETIRDFNRHEGDRIDIRQVVEGHCSSHDDLSNFVRVDCHDGNTVVKVDESGSGCNFKDVAVLVGVGSCSVDSMIADGSLEVGRFHS